MPNGINPPDGWKNEPVEYKDALIELAFKTVNNLLAVIVDAAEDGNTMCMEVVAVTATIFGPKDDSNA